MVFKHKDPCATLTQAEYIAACGDGHIFACQATGDILYASSATVLSKLAKGNQHEILSMGGSNIPAWTASPSMTDLTISGGCITLSAATDIDLLDDNASALSFDSTGKAGIIDIVTTDCSEGVTMSGTLGVTGALTATAGITVGSDGSGADVTFHSATGSDNFLWDASCEKLVITGTNAQTALCIADGNVVIADTLYFYDAGGEYISSNGSVLAITGATTISSTLGVTGAITANAGVVVDCLTIDACTITAGAAFTIDATTDIVLDADGDNITFKAGSGDSTGLDFSNSSGTWTIKPGTANADLIFNVNDGCVDTKVMAIDAGDSVVTFGGNSVKSGEIRILEDTDAGANYTAIKVGNMAANVTYTLPTNVAASCGLFLKSTCAGVLSWAAAGGDDHHHWLPSQTFTSSTGARAQHYDYSALNLATTSTDTFSASGFFHSTPSNIRLIVTSIGTGNLKYYVTSDMGARCADLQSHQDSEGSDGSPLTLSCIVGDRIYGISLNDSFTCAAACDYFGFIFARDGDDGGDTLNNNLAVLGLLIEY